MKNYLTIRAICPSDGNPVDPKQCSKCRNWVNTIETETRRFIICRLVKDLWVEADYSVSELGVLRK